MDKPHWACPCDDQPTLHDGYDHCQMHVQRRLIASGVIGLLLLVGAFAWLESMRSYYRSIDPSLARQSLGEFIRAQRDRLDCAYLITNGSQRYYELRGKPAKLYLPSDGPGYIFDDNCKLIDWIADRGESQDYYDKWIRRATAYEPVDMSTLERKCAE